jgi:glycolate oxidase
MIDALGMELSAGALVTDPAVMDAYRRDRAATAPVGEPIAVVRAARRADVQATLRIASRYGVPVVTRGAGTGLSGGSIGDRRGDHAVD